MSYASTMRTLSNIDCALSSVLGYVQDRQSGKSVAQSAVGFVGNIGNGFARNEVAYQMQRHGNSTGNFLNMAYGYGSPEANAAGTLGLMMANNPWMFFNMMPTCTVPYPQMGMGYPMMGNISMGGYYC